MEASKSNIIYKDNFIEKTINKEILEYLKFEMDWSSNYFEEGTWGSKSGFTWVNTPFNVPIYERLNQISIELLNLAMFKYGRHLRSIHNIICRKWEIGESQAAHSDTESVDENGMLEPFPENVSSGSRPLYLADYSCYVYLNDDYEGGEIFFPEHGIEIKPTAGSALIFPSGNHYVHGVKRVEGTNRYTLGMYFTSPKVMGLFSKELLREHSMYIGGENA